MSGEFRREGYRRDGVRSSLIWEVLLGVVSARVAQTGRQALDIVDAGGGTGGLAVPFAALGHAVTVVDPSPDALAAAKRRAAEVDAPLSTVQGEAASLDGVVGAGAANLVICHNVLEYVDSPADAMAAIARVLRPAATVSVLSANAVAAILHRALAGRFAEARQLVPEVRSADEHWLGASGEADGLSGPVPGGAAGGTASHGGSPWTALPRFWKARGWSLARRTGCGSSTA